MRYIDLIDMLMKMHKKFNHCSYSMNVEGYTFKNEAEKGQRIIRNVPIWNKHKIAYDIFTLSGNGGSN